MKTERRYIDFMQDIVDNLEKAESFTEGLEFEDFIEDEKTRYSVICALEIVGEASKKVPTAIRKRNPQVPPGERAGADACAWGRGGPRGHEDVGAGRTGSLLSSGVS